MQEVLLEIVNSLFLHRSVTLGQFKTVMRAGLKLGHTDSFEPRANHRCCRRILLVTQLQTSSQKQLGYNRVCPAAVLSNEFLPIAQVCVVNQLCELLPCSWSIHGEGEVALATVRLGEIVERVENVAVIVPARMANWENVGPW